MRSVIILRISMIVEGCSKNFKSVQASFKHITESERLARDAYGCAMNSNASPGTVAMCLKVVQSGVKDV